MLSKESRQLAGINLRQDETDIDDKNATKAVNLDPSVRAGSVVIRRGRSDLGGVTISDLILRYLSKVNGFRYQIAGRKIYRDMVAITDNVLHEAQIETTIVPFRDLQDAYIWAFVADDDIMLKDNGTVLYQWGIDLIPTPDPQICNQTGKVASDTITAGRYTGAVTQIRFVNPDVQGPDFVGEIEGAL